LQDAFALNGKLLYYAAMNDSRDLDEMLASLDALLREGGSHNDDMPVEHASEKVIEEESIKHGVSDTVISEDDLETQLDASERLDKVGEAELLEGSEQSEQVIARVILTEDMLVENPQVSLPLGLAATSECKGAISEFVEVEAEASCDYEEEQDEPVDETVADLPEQGMEQLLAMVTEDISSQLQDILPSLIKDSLHKHLSAMQDDDDEKNISDDE